MRLSHPFYFLQKFSKVGGEVTLKIEFFTRNRMNKADAAGVQTLAV